jgi:hypothetical protein
MAMGTGVVDPDCGGSATGDGHASAQQGCADEHDSLQLRSPRPRLCGASVLECDGQSGAVGPPRGHGRHHPYQCVHPCEPLPGGSFPNIAIEQICAEHPYISRTWNRSANSQAMIKNSLDPLITST